MPGIDLKHYDTYLQSLELYAEASGLTVEYGEMDSPGVYVPSRRKIRIDPDLSPLRLRKRSWMGPIRLTMLIRLPSASQPWC
jgi:hypothetical protein